MPSPVPPPEPQTIPDEPRWPGGWPIFPPRDWPADWPYPPPFKKNRNFFERLLPFLGVSCCGPACCNDHWNHCSDNYSRECCDGDCGDCGDCCDCDCCDCDCGGCCDCSC